ncbi:ISAzo13-like element transposase-related protein [Streptomyces chartreusis]|uniref:ISAzo13-like element transposase-related protein n=1 Tax=Streptomyces chartreusis TaxID=1969 RepID=UPI00386C9485
MEICCARRACARRPLPRPSGGKQHLDRDGQFRSVNGQAGGHMDAGQPMRRGHEEEGARRRLYGRGPSGGLSLSRSLAKTHDFPPAATGQGDPYGIYDTTTNTDRASVGTGYDTAASAAGRRPRRSQVRDRPVDGQVGAGEALILSGLAAAVVQNRAEQFHAPLSRGREQGSSGVASIHDRHVRQQLPSCKRRLMDRFGHLRADHHGLGGGHLSDRVRCIRLTGLGPCAS